MDLSGCTYERDLQPMKFRILISVRHDRTVRAIAARLRIPVHEAQRLLVRRFDMQLLENLPARYEAGLRTEEEETDGVARALGAWLFTRAVPFLTGAEMAMILDAVREKIASGTPRDAAVGEGISEIRRVAGQ
jgi:energy-converting hydrogenase A subunit M